MLCGGLFFARLSRAPFFTFTYSVSVDAAVARFSQHTLLFAILCFRRRWMRTTCKRTHNCVKCITRLWSDVSCRDARARAIRVCTARSGLNVLSYLLFSNKNNNTKNTIKSCEQEHKYSYKYIRKQDGNAGDKARGGTKTMRRLEKRRVSR